MKYEISGWREKGLECYEIQGGKRLLGEVHISGAKNAVLPVLAAAVAGGGESCITNCPNISDVAMMLKLLRGLGCRCRVYGDTITVDSSNIDSVSIDEEHMKGMRSSIFLTGAILGRFGEVEIGQPGGCRIGKRPIDIHLKALEQLGAQVEVKGDKICCTAGRAGLRGTKIRLDFASVGATENVMLAAVFAEGDTILENCAKEPEICELAGFLTACGANIRGAGSDRIYIKGKSPLSGTDYRIIPDRIESGTFLAAAAATHGSVTVRDTRPEHMRATLDAFRAAGCGVREFSDSVSLTANDRLRGIRLKTGTYPEFPTDMQSPMVAALCTAEGTSVVSERIFENRFNFTKELKYMQADIEIDEKSAIINGVRKLYGTTVTAGDLRGGAALVVAGLGAEGTTTVRDVYHIERGYENFHEKLAGLGADIKMNEG